MRPFLLFLFWACLSQSYVLFMTASLLVAHRQEFKLPPLPPPVGFLPRATRWVVAASVGAWYLVAAAPWWLCVAYYMAAAAVATLGALSCLLGSQLHYLALGVNYIDFLQHAASERQRQQQYAATGGWVPAADAGGQQGAPPPAAGPTRSWRRLYGRLADIFGSSNPVMWLLPRWEHVPGTFLEAVPKKQL